MVIGRLEGLVKLEEKRKKLWEDATPAKLREYARQLGVEEITEEERKQQVTAFGRRVDNVATVTSTARNSRRSGRNWPSSTPT